MASGEFHSGYFEYINARINKDLLNNGVQDDTRLPRVGSVVNNIIILKELKSLTPEEAENLYQRILELYPEYPQFAEKLNEELAKL